MKLLSLATIGFGIMLLFNIAAAQQTMPYGQHQRGKVVPQTQGTTGTTNDAMIAEIQASDARLQMASQRMRAATGVEKVQAMEAVVNELVANDLKMHQHLLSMLQQGDTTPRMPK